MAAAIVNMFRLRLPFATGFGPPPNPIGALRVITSLRLKIDLLTVVLVPSPGMHDAFVDATHNKLTSSSPSDPTPPS